MQPAQGVPIASAIVTRGLSTIIAILASISLVSACAPQSNEKRATGQRPSFVSLNPCLDAILVEVAQDKQILALSHYSFQPGGSRMDPAIAGRFAATGGTAEEVIALAPDIVLASVFLPAPTQSALEHAGLRVETFGSPRSVAESAVQVERMGALVGDASAADALRARLLGVAAGDSSDGASAKPAKAAPSVLLWQAGQIVAGQETLIAELIKEAGFSSHAEALGFDQADYVTLEQVLSEPPDVLLVAGDSAGQRHPALAQLSSTQVHAFDPSLFFCAGPSIAEARAELIRLRELSERQGG